MPTIEAIQTQVHDFQDRALEAVKTVQDQGVEYVAKAAGTLAERVPADRPELLVTVIDAVTHQAGFAKQVLDTEVTFVKSVIDAAVKPFTPAKKKAAVKAA